jgi:hypothetical protein
VNHGIATLHRDWDIFKKGDQFVITAYLQDGTYADDPIFAIWVGGMRGCTVNWLTFHWTRKEIDAWFDLELDGECCKNKSDNDLPDDEFQKKYAGPI